MFQFLKRGKTPRTPKRKLARRRLEMDILEARRLLATAAGMPTYTEVRVVHQPVVVDGYVELAAEAETVAITWEVWRDVPQFEEDGTPISPVWDEDDIPIYLGPNPNSLQLEIFELADPVYATDKFSFTPETTGDYFVRFTANDGSDEIATAEFLSLNVGEDGSDIVATVAELPGNVLIPGHVVSALGSFSGSVANPAYTWEVFKNGTLFDDGTGTNIQFTPNSAGQYEIQFHLFNVVSTVIIVEGQPVVVDTPVLVDEASLELHVDNSEVVGGTLLIAGNAGGSDVFVNAASGGLNVTVDGSTTLYSGVSAINIVGQQGSDLITVLGNIAAPITIDAGAGNDTILIGLAVTSKVIAFGGAGNDILVGGNGNNVLVGGLGNDLLTGGSARDVLIGGDGTDLLLGNSQDDILIAGYTDYDSNAAALDYLLGKWTEPTAFTNRVILLRTTSLTEPYLNAATVHDDNDIDIVLGLAGTDWFFVNRNGSGAKDITLDANGTEVGRLVDL